ncbi:unnamed protein product [Schistosoma mattheei]|uniref:RIC1 C-terminal alpha solenoid region domain-containing protein n=1 Tax=Schistosoma mattheei TaxID=31246 RepID=A0A183NNE7_9TREM|nr:unnamed protein product [Schistosoma mattheei]
MVKPTGTYVPANIARLGHHDRQARPPRQGSSSGRDANQLQRWFQDHHDLGIHAFQMSLAYQHLPYFPRILELLLHEVLEVEAASKIPTPGKKFKYNICLSLFYCLFAPTI